MNRLHRTGVAVLAAGATTLGWLYWAQQARVREAVALRREIADLRVRIEAERERSRAVAAVAAVVDRVPDTPVASPAPSRGPEVPPSPPPIYRNAGRATPRATLQTLAWASDRGDVAAVGALLVFDEAARVKAQQFFDALPPEARGDWRTVDDMAAMLMTRSGMEAPFPAADVLEAVEIETLGPDRARMRMRGTRRDGSEFQRTSEGWSYVITEAMVDRYTRQAANTR